MMTEHSITFYSISKRSEESRFLRLSDSKSYQLFSKTIDEEKTPKRSPLIHQGSRKGEKTIRIEQLKFTSSTDNNLPRFGWIVVAAKITVSQSRGDTPNISDLFSNPVPGTYQNFYRSI
jgi:hypothetical protein